MINKKRIIAALNQLNATKDEHKEWLAIRREIGADLDPDNVHVYCIHAQVLDPYGICPSFPTALYLIGREYFARAPNSGVWVSFDDLPRGTVSRLWPRMQAGEFDGPMKPKWKWADDHGISPNRMFWHPMAGPLAAVPVAGRVAIRTTTQTRGPLIVKDADLGSFVLGILEHDTVYAAGWIDVRAAKQFPSQTALGSAVHFIEQSQLDRMDDLQKYIETGLGKWVDTTH